MRKLEIKGLSKNFGKREVFSPIDFQVLSGEFLSVLGPSGCGKTTLLRILMGIETPTSGRILKDGNDITNLHPSKRGMGMVFQNYALFPNMDVLNNVMFALKYTNGAISPKERAMEVIEKVGLLDCLNRRPEKLSGGQQQRVAIARTLALNPDVVLFDEPMSALDAGNRLSLRQEFKQIQSEFGVTMIYVTHDQEEAFSMSDRVMVMNDGKIEQMDTPHNIYNNPASEFINEFVVRHLDEKVKSICRSTGISHV